VSCRIPMVERTNNRHPPGVRDRAAGEPKNNRHQPHCITLSSRCSPAVTVRHKSTYQKQIRAVGNPPYVRTVEACTTPADLRWTTARARARRASCPYGGDGQRLPLPGNAGWMIEPHPRGRGWPWKRDQACGKRATTPSRSRSRMISVRRSTLIRPLSRNRFIVMVTVSRVEPIIWARSW
jgi:hypothetical protein